MSDMKMFRYHVWIDPSDWDAEPERSSAVFLGACNDIDGVIDCVKANYERKKRECVDSWAVVTLGDMSPAGLSASGGEDPDDMCVEWIGHYSAEEAQKLMPKWKKEYADYLNNGCWIDTILDESEGVGLLVEEISVWDEDADAWRRLWEDDSVEQWRKEMNKPAKNQHGETSLPFPEGAER